MPTRCLIACSKITVNALLKCDSFLKMPESLIFPDELTVPRYRTEKPSKSPPPPPPRRSFPSSPGLITRSGEPLIPGKSIKVRQRKFKHAVLLCMLHHIKYGLWNQNNLLIKWTMFWLCKDFNTSVQPYGKKIICANLLFCKPKDFSCELKTLCLLITCSSCWHRYIQSLFCLWDHRSLNLKRPKARSLMWNWGGPCPKTPVLHLRPPLSPLGTRRKERKRKLLLNWR